MAITESKLKSGVLTFGPEDKLLLTASCQATAVTLEPDFEDTGDAVETLCGDALTASQTTMWSLNFTGIQDWTNVEGFVNFAFDHDGETVDFTWTPNANGPTWTGKCTVKAVLIGGDVDARLTTDAEWPVAGKPVRADKAPPESQGSESVPPAGTSATKGPARS
jgi:hypothetical protein